MARVIHIHVHSKRRSKARDTAPELSPMEDLVERLLAAIKARKTHATQDEEEGHEFHGNQYTSVAGASEKPTKATAKGSKAGVHELLSTGHHFTLEELMAATGVDNKSTILTALSDLKNPKYAGKLGALQINKHASGHYHVTKADGTTPHVQPPPAPAKPEEKAKPPTISGFTAQPPATPMTKAAADAIYTAGLHDLSAQCGADVTDGEDPWGVAAHWKKQKAQLMAQWAANTSGKPTLANKVDVYHEDALLMEHLADADQGKTTVPAALQKWKDLTAAAKAKALAPKPPPAKKTPESHKPGPVTAGKVDPVPDHKGISMPPAPTHYVPKDWEGVNTKDFESGPNKQPEFSRKMRAAHAKLYDGHTEPSTNKAEVQVGLEKRLNDTPHFSYWAKKYKNGSLVSKLISSWAGSSGDHHPDSVALQHAVQQAFNMNKDDLHMDALAGGHKATHLEVTAGCMKSLGLSGNPLPQEVESFHTALKDFVLAQYHETQDHLKKSGITEVCVARGMADHEGSHGEVVNMSLQPASSFSTDLPTAIKFSKGHMVYFSKVPASQVLSTFRTGFGCTHEHEVVVLADDKMRGVSCASHKASSGGGVTNVVAELGKKVTTWH